jgi:hypothetical protein
MVDQLRLNPAFDAYESFGKGMCGISLDSNYFAVLDMNQHTTFRMRGLATCPDNRFHSTLRKVNREKGLSYLRHPFSPTVIF